ncbi:MAG TPA: general secretion pathway protein GspB [Steroidobacteraceae bacterium]|nr:general secretion pathway protein GspB [Steroidobacteraceae bacterium]
MSFILDALKKSENDRQRQSGPALFEVRVAPPRAGFPTWAYALLALLAVNLVVVGWILLRKPAAASTRQMAATESKAVTSAPASPSAPTSTTAQAAPAAQPPVAQAAPPPAATYAAPPQPAYAPPQYPQQAYAPAYPQQAYAQQGYVQPQGYPPPGYAQPGYPQAQGYPPQQNYPVGPPAQNGGYAPPAQQQAYSAPPEGNPDDYAPAKEPSEATSTFGHVRRGLENGLMTYEEAAQKNSLPPLHLDLHVYAPDPSKRFVLVNGNKANEGQSIEGVRVDSITPDGVVMSYRGVQFMLLRE